MNRVSIAVSVLLAAAVASVFLLPRPAALAGERRPLPESLPVEDPRPRGEGDVVVAVVDTGVDPRHPALQKCLLPGINVCEPDQPADDLAGHGTAIAGLIAAEDDDPQLRGVAAGGSVRILPVKVTPGAETATLPAFVAMGIEKAVDAGARVICVPMGASCSTRALDAAVERAWERGVLVVAAAGITEGAFDLWPAMHPKVVSCSASMPGSVDFPDGSKPTVECTASKANVSGKTEFIGEAHAACLAPGGGRGTLDGTSVVCARVAGVAARLAEARRDLDAAALRRIVCLSAPPLLEPNGTAGCDTRVFSAAAIVSHLAAEGGRDVAVLDALPIPGPLEPGAPGTLVVRVANVGGKAVDGTLRLDVPSLKVAVEQPLTVPAGAAAQRVQLQVPALPAGDHVGAVAFVSKEDGNGLNDRVHVQLVVMKPEELPILMLRPRLDRLRFEDLKVEFVAEMVNASAKPIAGKLMVTISGKGTSAPAEIPERGSKEVRLEADLPPLPQGKRGHMIDLVFDVGGKVASWVQVPIRLDLTTAGIQYADVWERKEIIFDAPAFVAEGRESVPVLIFAPEIHTAALPAWNDFGDPRIGTPLKKFGVWISHIRLEELDPAVALQQDLLPWGVPPATLPALREEGRDRVNVLLEARDRDQRAPSGEAEIRAIHPDVTIENGLGAPFLREGLTPFVNADGWHVVVNVPVRAFLNCGGPEVYVRGFAEYRDFARNVWDGRRFTHGAGPTEYADVVLRTQLHVSLPRLHAGGQYYDAHVHTAAEFSRDAVEPRLAFGGPPWMLVRAAYAMGFVDAEFLNAVAAGGPGGREVLLTTDHNCFLTDADVPDDLPWRFTGGDWPTLRRFAGAGASQELAVAAAGRAFGSPHALVYGHEPFRGPWHGGRNLRDKVLQVKDFMDSLAFFGATRVMEPSLQKTLVCLACSATLRGAFVGYAKDTLGAKCPKGLTEESLKALCDCWARFTDADLQGLIGDARRALEPALARDDTNANTVEAVEAALAPDGRWVAAHPKAGFNLHWEDEALARAANVVPGSGDVPAAAGRFSFRGVQVWNEPMFFRTELSTPDRIARANVWRAGFLKLNPEWHREWMTGFLHYTDRLLAPALKYSFDPEGAPRRQFARKLFHYAGSDAHGSFNYTTGVGGTVATHPKLAPLFEIFGHCHSSQTNSSHYGAARVYAERARFEEVDFGRVVCTDGPLVWPALDSDLKFDARALVWHESWDSPLQAGDDDGQIGGGGTFDGLRTALVRRACGHMVLRYRVSEPANNGERIERLEVYRAGSGGVTRELDRANVWVPKADDRWAPGEGAGLQARVLATLAPAEPVALIVAGFTAWSPRADVRFDVNTRRCVANPIWLTTVEIGAAATPVVENGRAVVPPGKFVATFRTDHSMFEEATAVLLKQFNGQGDSVGATYRLVPRRSPEEGFWRRQARTDGGKEVVIEDCFLEAVNEEPIPLAPDWYPREGVDTFAVILASPRDTHGNPLNAVAGKVEIGVPAGTVIEPQPDPGSDPAGGDRGAITPENRPPDTACVAVRTGDRVHLPKGATHQGRPIPAGEWQVPEIPAAGLPLQVTHGGQTLTIVLVSTPVPADAMIERTNPGFFGTVPVGGPETPRLSLKNFSTRTVEAPDPVLVTGSTCVFSAPEAEAGVCDLTVEQGARKRTWRIEAVAVRLTWDNSDAQVGDLRELRLVLEGASEPAKWTVSGAIQIENGRIEAVSEPGKVLSSGNQLDLRAISGAVSWVARCRTETTGEMLAKGRLRAVRAPGK